MTEQALQITLSTKWGFKHTIPVKPSEVEILHRSDVEHQVVDELKDASRMDDDFINDEGVEDGYTTTDSENEKTMSICSESEEE